MNTRQITKGVSTSRHLFGGVHVSGHVSHTTYPGASYDNWLQRTSGWPGGGPPGAMVLVRCLEVMLHAMPMVVQGR